VIPVQKSLHELAGYIHLLVLSPLHAGWACGGGYELFGSFWQGRSHVPCVLIGLLSRFSLGFFVCGFPAGADIVLGLPSKQKHKIFVSLDFAVVVAGANGFTVGVNKHKQFRNARLLYAAG